MIPISTITIKADKLKLSDNDLKIVVENYQPVKLTLTVNKEQENISLSAPESVELGNDVTITCSSADHVNGVCDFFKYLNKNTAVRMTGLMARLTMYCRMVRKALILVGRSRQYADDWCKPV